jgi:DNA polymerase III delta prime subunit
MKVYQVFELSPLFYQNYIPPALKKINETEGLESKIIAYEGIQNRRSKPLYYLHIILEKL